MINERIRSHELLKFVDKGPGRNQNVVYDHLYLKNDPVHNEMLYKIDPVTKERLPNVHTGQHDVNGVWYLYSPDNYVIDSLNDQQFDAGDIAFILSKLDHKIKVDESEDIYSSIFNRVRSTSRPFSTLRESYIWSVLLSDNEVHEFIGDSNNDLKAQVRRYCADNDLEIVNLMNVKHVRDDREMDQEYLSAIEESLNGYELSWTEKTRGNKEIMKTKTFKSMDALTAFKKSLSSHPRFSSFLGIVEPDGTSYVTEAHNQLLDVSRTGRYELYRNDEDGTLRVLDTETHKYVNADISTEEDFESWKDD